MIMQCVWSFTGGPAIQDRLTNQVPAFLSFGHFRLTDSTTHRCVLFNSTLSQRATSASATTNTTAIGYVGVAQEQRTGAGRNLRAAAPAGAVV